jgi:hypothetical protein
MRGHVLQFALILGLCLQSCAPKEDEETVKECVLPQDQSSTLSGRWAKTVIPIALKQGDFSPTETAAIIQAAMTWNAHYSSVAGVPVLDYGSITSPRTSTQAQPTSLCSYSLMNNATGNFQGSVVIYKKTTWNYDAQAIALTSYCTNPGSPLKSMYMAVMEVNFQNFFMGVDSTGAPNRKPDLTSIFLHEFGHLLGLDHSCKTTGATSTFVSCSSADQAYYDAVMYPAVFFDTNRNGQVKTTLMSNDQGRSNCLYGPKAM